MNFCLFLKLFKSRKVIPTSANYVSFTSDLETEGHVLVYVTFVIPACIRPTATIFFQMEEFILTIAYCVIFTCDLEN